MPTEYTATSYKFHELSPKAKERAIEKGRQWLWDDVDAKDLTEWFSERLEEVGLPSEDVRWRLSYSQGDGVAFYGKMDLEEYVAKNKLKSKYKDLFKDDFEAYVTFEIDRRGSGNYDHWNTMRVECYASHRDPTQKQAELLDELREHVQEQAATVSREFERAGYDAIENKTSDEAVAEYLEANDYDFDASGKML